LIVVVSGRVKPVVHSADGGELTIIQPRGVLGEVASVRTRQECTLLRIDGQEFLSALQATRPSASLLAIAGARMARTPSRNPRPTPPA
jgi:CRP-like cAMP-binding protein